MNFDQTFVFHWMLWCI